MKHPANHDGAEFDNYFARLTMEEVGSMLLASASKLRKGPHAERELHRRVVEACLDALAEKGRKK